MRRVEDARRTSRAATDPLLPLVRPFPGLRYAPDVAGPLSSLLAPPHTELDRAARKALLSSSPYVVTHLERPEYDPGPGRAVTRWLAEGALVQDDPGLYVVRQQQRGRTQHFLLGQLDIAADDARVRPHEGVFERAVEARLERLEVTGVDSEPVLVVDNDPWPLPWTDPSALGHLVAAATDDVRHVEVWYLDDPEVVARLSGASAQHRFLIADGHHRYAAVQRAARRDGVPRSLLVAVVDDETEPVDLRALHRSVPRTIADAVISKAPHRRRFDRTGTTALASVIDALAFDEALVVTDTAATVIGCPADGGHATGSGAWIDAATSDLGSADSDIHYCADIGALWNVPRDRSAIFLPRPRIDALREMALHGKVMGRKTTSFRPKPLAGTVLRLR